MTSTWDLYNRSAHGELGVGKRPDELPGPQPFDLTATEAARLARVTHNTILDWIAKGQLPSERRNRVRFFRRRDVERLAERVV